MSLMVRYILLLFFFFQAEDGIRDVAVTGVQTCALPISFIEQGGGETIVPGGLDCLLLVEFERETAAAARGVVGDAVRGLKHLTHWVETEIGRASCRERV